MQKIRSKADNFLMKQDNLDIKFLIDKTKKNTLDEHEMFPVWDVIEFFVRLQTALRYDRLDKKIAVDLFGRVFLYWYYMYFYKALRDSNFDQKQQFDTLYGFFRGEAGGDRLTGWFNDLEKEYPARMWDKDGASTVFPR